MSEEREKLTKEAADLSRYGRKFEKAIDTVLAGGVKECRFLPSSRKIFSVVGRLGEEFIDPERPYCSCSNFYFRVSGGNEEQCYHLLSYMIAAKTGKSAVVEFNDDEYGDYFSALVKDVFNLLSRSG